MNRRGRAAGRNIFAVKAAGGAVLLGLVCGLLFPACETQKSLTKKRIDRVEKGLLRAIFFKGQAPGKMRLLDRMTFYRVPGISLAVFDKHGVEWSKSYGIKDVRTLEPVTADTLFQGGALSQSVAAAAVLRLVDSGHIGLDEPVNNQLRGWKIPPTAFTAGKGVTLRGLMTHTAGLPAQVFSGYPEGQPVPTLLQVLEGAKPASNRPIALDSEPGAKMRATEADFVVLQKVMEDTAGKPFAAQIKEAVLEPLGMKHTTFEIPLPGAIRTQAASGHVRGGQAVDCGWNAYPELAAKGIWTTPSDLAVFIGEILGTAMSGSGKILTPASARAMLTPQVGGRGLGFMVDGAGADMRFHLQGRTRGFASSLVVYPDRGQGAILMTNSDNGFFLIDEILRAISEVYLWPDFKPEEKPLYRLDPAICAEYVGRYEVTPDYALDVRHEDYYLIIQPTGQAPTKFYVETQSIFFSVDPFIRIQFRRNDAGRVDGLVLWQQDFEQTARKTD